MCIQNLFYKVMAAPNLRVQMISTILTIGLTLSINFYDHTKKFTQHVNLTLIKAGVGKSMFSIASPRYEHKRVKEDLS